MTAPTENISDEELCELLERNGYPSAAEMIARGEDRADATRYILDQPFRYGDGEERWLHDYIASIQPPPTGTGAAGE